MIYKVKLNYEYFRFNNLEEASIFAEMAKRHSEENIRVNIEIMNDKDCRKEEEDD